MGCHLRMSCGGWDRPGPQGAAALATALASISPRDGKIVSLVEPVFDKSYSLGGMGSFYVGLVIDPPFVVSSMLSFQMAT